MVAFRSSRTRSQALAETTSTRTRPGQIDHDVFEGLPVRRWARQPTTISQTPKVEVAEMNLMGSQTLPELPMPKDSHLLTPLSRALLRAARAGCTYIKPGAKEPDAKEPGAKELGAKEPAAKEPAAKEPAAKEPSAKDPGVGEKEIKEVKGAETAGASSTVKPTNYERNFTAVKWTTIPRNLEPPEPEFLAKRKTGLRSLYGASTATASGVGFGTANVESQVPMRKTKFKKVDATGKVSVYEAWVPSGHRVEGEIIDEVEIAAVENTDVTVGSNSLAPGSIVDGAGVGVKAGVVDAQPEASMVAVVTERTAPPKRKAKGPGRGKKKKVMFSDNDVAASQAPASESAGQGGDVTQRSDQGEMNVDADEEDEDEEEDGYGSEDEQESLNNSKSQNKSETPQILDTASSGQHSEVAAPHAQSPAFSENKLRDKSSSPDLPLSQAAAGRPEVTTVRDEVKPETIETPVAMPSIDIQSIPKVEQTSSDGIQVSATSTIPSQSLIDTEMADIPDETAPSPLNELGLSEQQANVESRNSLAPESPRMKEPLPVLSSGNSIEPVRFENGEVDLLGSLEASLDSHLQTSEEPTTDVPPDQQNTNDDIGDATMIVD